MDSFAKRKSRERSSEHIAIQCLTENLEQTAAMPAATVVPRVRLAEGHMPCELGLLAADFQITHWTEGPSSSSKMCSESCVQ